MRFVVVVMAALQCVACGELPFALLGPDAGESVSARPDAGAVGAEPYRPIRFPPHVDVDVSLGQGWDVLQREPRAQCLQPVGGTELEKTGEAVFRSTLRTQNALELELAVDALSDVPSAIRSAVIEEGLAVIAPGRFVTQDLYWVSLFRESWAYAPTCDQCHSSLFVAKCGHASFGLLEWGAWVVVTGHASSWKGAITYVSARAIGVDASLPPEAMGEKVWGRLEGWAANLIRDYPTRGPGPAPVGMMIEAHQTFLEDELERCVTDPDGIEAVAAQRWCARRMAIAAFGPHASSLRSNTRWAERVLFDLLLPARHQATLRRELEELRPCIEEQRPGALERCIRLVSSGADACEACDMPEACDASALSSRIRDATNPAWLSVLAQLNAEP